MPRKPLSWIRKPAPYDGMSDCMIVTSHSVGSHGYPRVEINGSGQLIHRVVCGRRHDIKDKKVRHICDTRTCINPDHLIPGSDLDNVQDAVARGRHAYGERFGRAKLTNKEAIEIFNSTGNNTQTAIKFGVSRTTVSEIRSRKIWKRVLPATKSTT